MLNLCKKLSILLCLGTAWAALCGFEGLDTDVDVTAGIASVMDDLTVEDMEEIQEIDEWDDKILANVDEYVNVRSEPNSEAEVIGRLFAGDGGEILEELDGWTKISSGNVEGYVSNEYLLFDEEAYEQAQEELTLTATTTTAGLRIRAEASTDSKILKTVEEGTKLDVTDASDEDSEWIEVTYAEDKTGYVSAEYVELEYELGEAMTMEEIEEKEAEEKAEALKQQLAAVKASTDDVTLLAALIQAEGGGQPYEGQVAIGAVVVNRLKSGRYGSTIADVIYASGQFGVVSNGSILNYISNPKASCVQAAQEAISGYTNIGTFTHFKNASLSVSGDCIVIGSHVFY